MTGKQNEPCTATPQEKCTALETAFRNLKIKRPQTVIGIPYEFLIPGMGRELLHMTPIQRPKAVPAKKALRNLVKSADRMVKALDCLPQPVLEALNFKSAAMRDLKFKLRILHCAAKSANVKGDKGAPQKAQPAKIALVVAQHYFGLTGDKPTVPKRGGKAYGSFLNLLETVFGILCVHASAESQGNKIAKDWDSIVAKF